MSGYSAAARVPYVGNRPYIELDIALGLINEYLSAIGHAKAKLTAHLEAMIRRELETLGFTATFRQNPTTRYNVVGIEGRIGFNGQTISVDPKPTGERRDRIREIVTGYEKQRLHAEQVLGKSERETMLVKFPLLDAAMNHATVEAFYRPHGSENLHIYAILGSGLVYGAYINLRRIAASLSQLRPEAPSISVERMKYLTPFYFEGDVAEQLRNIADDHEARIFLVRTMFENIEPVELIKHALSRIQRLERAIDEMEGTLPEGRKRVPKQFPFRSLEIVHI
ncbi:hypothetical protein HYY71_05415 [Candidatus Woesearchaeota archaeon]|nr:hypothetical protein [Candidatus Woesearchaeota archaeon]